VDALINAERRMLGLCRYPSIQQQDRNLTHNISFLEEGTRARNREFSEQLQHIHEKIEAVTLKVGCGSLDIH
jgi:hypothetical protein